MKIILPQSAYRGVLCLSVKHSMLTPVRHSTYTQILQSVQRLPLFPWSLVGLKRKSHKSPKTTFCSLSLYVSNSSYVFHNIWKDIFLSWPLPLHFHLSWGIFIISSLTMLEHIGWWGAGWFPLPLKPIGRGCCKKHNEGSQHLVGLC